MEKVKKVVEWFKSQPVPFKVISFAAAVLLALAALFFSSCSRSTLRFKGQGQVEFDYVGSERPVVVQSSNE